MKRYYIDVKLGKIPYNDRKKALSELPEILGISISQFWRLRRGLSNITLQQAEKIADYFGITIDELASDTKEEV